MDTIMAMRMQRIIQSKQDFSGIQSPGGLKGISCPRQGSGYCIQVSRGNVMYCGLAGHFFVKDIPHVLKVRVNADLDMRVRSEVDREGISSKEA